MSLGMKLAVGFGFVILISIAMGVIAITSMKKGGTTALILSSEYVPEVTVANNVERDTFHMLLKIRDYEYTGEEAFLIEARKNLDNVKQYLKDAIQHGMSSTRLSQLKVDAEKASQSILEYEKLIEETALLAKDINQQRQVAEDASRQYMKAGHDFLASQKEAMQGEIIAGLDSDQLEKRLNQISLVTEIIEVGNKVVAGTWEAESKRDTALLTKTLTMFDEATVKLDALQKICDFEGDLKRIEECRSAMLAYKTANTKLVSARADTAKKRAVLAESILNQAKNIAVKGMQDMANESNSTANTLSISSKAISIGLVVGILFSVALAFFIVRGITRSIQQVISALASSAAQVTSSSNQISSSSQTLAEGATEQAASLEETSASMEEMSSMTRQNSDNAGQVDSLMREALDTIKEADDSMLEMGRSMNEIAEASAATSKIIKTIDEIAFQTNLLALNAAVEAARAGEAGAGFAVVAEEVRNLAMRSTEAAKNTASLIEGTVTKVTRGKVIVSKATEAFHGVAESSTKVAGLIGEIATASKEQAQGFGQINQAITQMDTVTQQNSASAEESAAAAAELNSQSASMIDVVHELQVLVNGGVAQAATPPPATPTRRSAKGSSLPLTFLIQERQIKSQKQT
ncbi:MAG: methyl-accepting chemotaxis protein [Desulfobulbaceae bacterium]|nr:methyl-accepting chemotaxis protein [Desulfobulbaceae bacterium]